MIYQVVNILLIKKQAFKTLILRLDLRDYSAMYIQNIYTSIHSYINNKTIRSKSLEYKIRLIGSMLNNNNIKDAGFIVPLKYVSKFRILFNLPLLNCEIETDFSWLKECIISEIFKTA